MEVASGEGVVVTQNDMHKGKGALPLASASASSRLRMNCSCPYILPEGKFSGELRGSCSGKIAEETRGKREKSFKTFLREVLHIPKTN